MNHTRSAPGLSLWQTPACDDGKLSLESSHPRSPKALTLSEVCGAHLEIPPGSIRKENIIFTLVKWCCTSPCSLCGGCKKGLQRFAHFWHSQQSQDRTQLQDLYLWFQLLPKLPAEISHTPYSADPILTREKAHQLSLQMHNFTEAMIMYENIQTASRVLCPNIDIKLPHFYLQHDFSRIHKQWLRISHEKWNLVIFVYHHLFTSVIHSWTSRKICKQEQPHCLMHLYKYLSLHSGHGWPGTNLSHGIAQSCHEDQPGSA